MHILLCINALVLLDMVEVLETAGGRLSDALSGMPTLWPVDPIPE